MDSDTTPAQHDERGIPADDAACRRLIVHCLVAILVCVVALWMIGRTALYALHPHLRPQPAQQAGTVETCDLPCALRRLHEAEQKLRALEGSR